MNRQTQEEAVNHSQRWMGLRTMLMALWGICGGCSASTPSPLEASGPGRLMVSESTLDTENRYPEVVRVTTVLEGKTRGRCSGILIGPRLVLTAGHCVCKSRPDTTTGGAIIDSSACVTAATVKTVFYKPKEGIQDDASSESAVYRGAVRPHPQLKIHVTSQGAASGTADLAVIVLDEVVQGEVHPARLINTKVQTDEAILMVGYGYDQRTGGFQGDRHSGKNRVATFTKGGATFLAGKPLEIAQPVMPGGSIVIREPGSYMLEGDSGGPCFRQSDGALVGIAMTTSQPPLEFSEFTSTYYYRTWLEAELARAEKKEPATRPDAP